MFTVKTEPPIISIVGFSGSGKTTLLERLIPEFTRRGIRVGTIKHHLHDFDMDKPGKDSWRHKQAGAAVTIISTPSRIGMSMDVDHDHKPHELAPFFDGVDIILTEGYKQENNAKLEIFRPEVHEKPLSQGDEHLMALISDAPVDIGVPRFLTDDIEGLADFLINRFNLVQSVTITKQEAVS
jgi:molybdopterin-guanine dinucleotide biosynthesis adapter protein